MTYTDESLMPFGKHRGKKLANIPANYFIDFLDKLKDLDIGLKRYINENRDALLKERAKDDDRGDWGDFNT